MKTYSFCPNSEDKTCMLTLDCSDYAVSIFYQLFQEFAGPVQLQLITLESLSEVRTVQIALAELQRMPHVPHSWLSHTKTRGSVSEQPAVVYRALGIAAQRTLLCVEGSRSHGVRGSLRQLVEGRMSSEAKRRSLKLFPSPLRPTCSFSSNLSVSWSPCHFSLLWCRS